MTGFNKQQLWFDEERVLITGLLRLLSGFMEHPVAFSLSTFLLFLLFTLFSDFLCSWLHYLLCAAVKYGHPLPPLSIFFCSSLLFPRHFAMRRSLSVLFCSTVEERIGRGLQSAGCLTEQACHKLTGAWNTTKRRLSASASDSITVNHSERRPCLSLKSPSFRVVKFLESSGDTLKCAFFWMKSRLLNPSQSYK